MVGIFAEVERKTTSVVQELVGFPIGGVLVVPFVSEAFFGLKNALN